jgi:hypothetical protein
MKKVLGYFPFILVLSVVPYLFLSDLTLAQSLVISGLFALCGYQYHLQSKEAPNYSELFQKELNDNRKEIRELKEKYGKMTLESNRKTGSMAAFKF